MSEQLPETTASTTKDDVDHLPLPPGSSGLPLLGESLAALANINHFVSARHQTHGEIFRTHLNGKPTAILCGVKAAQWFFNTNENELTLGLNKQFEKLHGPEMVSLLRGQAHQTRRSILESALSPAMVDRLLPTAAAIAENHFAIWAGKEQYRPAFTAIRWMVFEIMNTLLARELTGYIDEMTHWFGTWNKGIISPFGINLPFTQFGRAMKANQRIHNTLNYIIEQRKAKGGAQKRDLLNTLLLRQRTNPADLTDSQIIMDVKNFMLQGFNATASLLTNTLLYIAKDRHLAIPLQDEQAQTSEYINLQALQQMPLLLRTIHEVMRLHPPIVVIMRQTIRDVSFNGYRIPAGWSVMLHPGSIHTKPQLWPQGERFDPTPNTPEFMASQAQQYHFTPYGGGRHKCPGDHLALGIVGVTLAQLLRRYSWQLAPKQSLKMQLLPVPHPKSGLLLRLERNNKPQ